MSLSNNPELNIITQMFLALLGDSFQSTTGGDVVTQAMKASMGFISPNSSLNSLIADTVGPEVSRQLFGDSPLAGYGGINTAWNIASNYRHELNYRNRLRDMSRVRGFMDNINTQMADEIEADMPGHITGHPSAAKVREVAVGNFLMGTKTLGMDLTQGMRRMGYFGAEFDITRNELMASPVTADAAREVEARRARLETAFFGDKAGGKGFIRETMEDFSGAGRGKYGSLKGDEVGYLFSELAKMGQIDVGANGIAPQTTENLQKLSRSISALRDVIQGPVSEIFRQVNAVMGTETVNTMGYQKAFVQMNTLRQIGENAGIGLGEAAQYAMGSAMVMKQLTGYTAGSGTTGGMITAMMGVHGEGIGWRGIDTGDYARTLTTRMTGANLSDTSMRVAAALNEIQDPGQKEAFRADVLQHRGILNPAEILAMANNRGANISASFIEQARFSEQARLTAAEDPTGGMAALNSNLDAAMMIRGNTLKDLLGGNLEGYEAASQQKFHKSVTDLTEFELNEVGVGNNITGALGRTTRGIANGFGWNNMDEIIRARRSSNLAVLAYREGRIMGGRSIEAAGAGGGIAGVLKEFGAGRISADKASEVMQNFLGQADKGKMLAVAMGPDEAKAFSDAVTNNLKDAKNQGKTEIELNEISQLSTDVFKAAAATGYALNDPGKKIEFEGRGLTQEEIRALAVGKEITGKDGGKYTINMKSGEVIDLGLGAKVKGRRPAGVQAGDAWTDEKTGKRFKEENNKIYEVEEGGFATEVAGTAEEYRKQQKQGSNAFERDVAKRAGVSAYDEMDTDKKQEVAAKIITEKLLANPDQVKAEGWQVKGKKIVDDKGEEVSHETLVEKGAKKGSAWGLGSDAEKAMGGMHDSPLKILEDILKEIKAFTQSGANSSNFLNKIANVFGGGKP